MTAPPAKPGEINYPLVDRFTAVHGAVGFALGAARLSFPSILAVAVGWELLERPLKENLPGLFPRRSQDSFQNALGDAVAMLVGWKIWQLTDQNRTLGAGK